MVVKCNFLSYFKWQAEKNSQIDRLIRVLIGDVRLYCIFWVKGAFNINRKIIEFIFKSDAIIADLSGWNPNVYYEMGVAHAIDNKTIMIIQEEDKLPFDVSTYNCIKYEQTEDGLDKLKNNISEFLLCIDDWCKHATNPVQDFKPFDAFVSKSEIVGLQKQIKEKEKLLAKSVLKTAYLNKEKEWTVTSGELTSKKREMVLLNEKIIHLQSDIEKKDRKINQLQIVIDEADKLKNSIIITPPEGMVHIPAGEFTMGTSDKLFERYLKEFGQDYKKYLEWERPVHKVWLDDFFIDKYLVTNQQFAEFLNDRGKVNDENGNKMIDKHKWGVHKTGNKWKPQKGFENFPVVYVTWFGTQQYAKWANKELPSEAQWEKAARGRKGFEYATKDGSIHKNLANYGHNIDKTSSVGNYPANPHGIFDMSGNVWEWCLDWFDENYYKSCPDKNPVNLKEKNSRVVRGGSWGIQVRDLRCASRDWVDPTGGYSDGGFRCARAYL